MRVDLTLLGSSTNCIGTTGNSEIALIPLYLFEKGVPLYGQLAVAVAEIPQRPLPLVPRGRSIRARRRLTLTQIVHSLYYIPGKFSSFFGIVMPKHNRARSVEEPQVVKTCTLLRMRLDLGLKRFEIESPNLGCIQLNP